MNDSDTPLSCALHPDGAPEDGCAECEDILAMFVEALLDVDPDSDHSR